MIDLNDIALFVQVVNNGSFAAAARHLGLPSNTVSRRVQNLEAELRVRLLQRSTRKLTLTNAGQMFYERCAGGVDGLNEATVELMSGLQEPSGLIRVAAPADFFDFFSMDWTAAFLVQNPKVSIEFLLSDATTDLIADRIDVAFRGGEMQDSGYIGRQTRCDGDQSLVASPAYIAVHGMPMSLNTLSNHSCLSFSKAGNHAVWRLESLNQIEEIQFVPRFSGNTVQSLRKAALSGIGIALLPNPVIRSDLDTGLLLHVLPQYKRTGRNLHVLYPSRRHLPIAVSMFIELVVEKLTADYTPKPSD